MQRSLEKPHAAHHLTHPTRLDLLPCLVFSSELILVLQFTIIADYGARVTKRASDTCCWYGRRPGVRENYGATRCGGSSLAA
jgi:hypothetical protein